MGPWVQFAAFFVVVVQLLLFVGLLRVAAVPFHRVATRLQNVLVAPRPFLERASFLASMLLSGTSPSFCRSPLASGNHTLQLGTRKKPNVCGPPQVLSRMPERSPWSCLICGTTCGSQKQDDEVSSLEAPTSLPGVRGQWKSRSPSARNTNNKANNAHTLPTSHTCHCPCTGCWPGRRFERIAPELLQTECGSGKPAKSSLQMP